MDLKVLLGIVVAFVISIFALAIGADMVRQVQVDQGETLTGGYFNNVSLAVSVISKSNTSVGNAHNALHESCAFTLASCKVYNTSNGYVVPTTNYTITSPSDCVLYFRLKDNLHNESGKKVSCPYTALGGNLYNITRSGMQSLTEFSDWMPTLALVVVSGLVIGFLGMFLVNRLR